MPDMNMGWMLMGESATRLAFRPTQVKKLAFFVLADSGIIVLALVAAFLIRFDFVMGIPYYRLIRPSIPLFLGVKIACFAFFRLYALSWRFVSLRDLANILKGALVAELALAAIIYVVRVDALAEFPRGVLLMDGILTLVAIAALRIAKRVALEVVRGSRHAGRGQRTIIVGAGNTGEMILRDMQRTHYAAYAPIAFLDDDANLIGSYLHGVRVAGRLEDLTVVIHDYRATAVIVAIQSLGHQQLRRIYRAAKDAGATDVKIVPHLYDVRQPQVQFQAIEDIKIEDLIRRQAVRVDDVAIRAAIEGKVILVTGAAGSIGSEIVRQVCRFHPRLIICFEIDETDLHHLELSLRRELRAFADRVRFVVGDVHDADRVTGVFTRFRPDVVFHAAAYKHVPMMEHNPSEAVRVNIVGTWNVAQAAHLAHTGRVILISTDKAVRPTSVMGATKRVAEQVCRAFDATSATDYLAVRFGNVLGSRGSVLPIFLDQLKRGGPLTVTHHEMRRYFMTIPEAVALVLQAGVMGSGGDTLVLDMGDPVRIVEFAEDLIRLHRLRPHVDIAIEFVGIRPGEKLFEELLTAEEGTVATKHQQIYIARSVERPVLADMETAVHAFARSAQFSDTGGIGIRKLLRERVQWYDAHAVTAEHAGVAVSAVLQMNTAPKPEERVASPRSEVRADARVRVSESI